MWQPWRLSHCTSDTTCKAACVFPFYKLKPSYIRYNHRQSTNVSNYHMQIRVELIFSESIEPKAPRWENEWCKRKLVGQVILVPGIPAKPLNMIHREQEPRYRVLDRVKSDFPWSDALTFEFWFFKPFPVAFMVKILPVRKKIGGKLQIL